MDSCLEENNGVRNNGVRKVELSDLKQVRELAVESGVFTDYEVGIIVEAIEDYAREPEDDELMTCVYAVGGEIAGFIVFAKGLGNHTYEVDWICVSKKHRRNGVGGKLLEYAENHIKSVGGRIMFIETESARHYDPARMLYEKMGYIALSVVKDYFDDGVDKLIYSKRLDSGVSRQKNTERYGLHLNRLKALLSSAVSFHVR